MIMKQCGQPPEVPHFTSDTCERTFKYNREHSLYKLKKHRLHDDCKEILKLLENNTSNNKYDDNEYNNNNHNNDTNSNIVVLEPLNPFRHAEEQLSDQAVKLNNQSWRARRKLTFQIRGKKRPCKGCAGYMASRGIIEHNKSSSFLFLDSMANQLRMEDHEPAKRTLQLLLNEDCWMSTKRPEAGVTARYTYDTDSDSDQEKYDLRDRSERQFLEYYARVEKHSKKSLSSSSSLPKFIVIDDRTRLRRKANRKNQHLTLNRKNNKLQQIQKAKPRNWILEVKSLKGNENMKHEHRAARQNRNAKSRDRKMTRMLKTMGLVRDCSEINQTTMDDFVSNQRQ